MYAFLLIGESLSEYMLVWIPGYRYVKCALIFWLASPRFKGAAVLYDKVVKDALKKAEPHVDKICALVAKGDVGGVRKQMVSFVFEVLGYFSSGFLRSRLSSRSRSAAGKLSRFLFLPPV